MKLSTSEICVANPKAPLRMLRVWVVNKSEKTVLEDIGYFCVAGGTPYLTPSLQ